MIYNTFEMHQEGSLPGAHLVTYIQEYSEAMAINDRPLILLCPGECHGEHDAALWNRL